MSDAGTGAGVGGRLAEARTALGLSEEDVADALNLSTRVIVDLESEAWDSLPAPAFTRGYIRAYVKLLDVDGEELIEGYERVVGVTDTVELELPLASAAPTAGVGELLQRQPGSVLSGAVVALVAAVVLIVWVVWPDGDADRIRVDAGATAALVQAESTRTPPAEPDAAAERAEADAPLPEPEPPEPIRDAPRLQPAEPIAVVPERPEPSGPSGPSEALAITEPTALAVTEPTAGATRVRRLSPAGDDRLRLEFSADCWVEVKDEANSSLFGDLGRAGDSLELIGAPPFRILLGYAPGVVLSYNGEPVQLAGYTRNNVAALWLGR